MNDRILALKVMIVIAMVALAGIALRTSRATAASLALKTSWNEPDLQGIWTDEYQTPLQRPARFAEREFLTAEERAELDKRSAGQLGSDRRAEKGSEADVAGAYNAVFTSRKRTGPRTSMIVDPPDGRIPPLTPEALQRQQEWREFYLALILPTDRCKDHLPGCENGKYDPNAQPKPLKYYPAAGKYNRSDGPEDRGLSERCMSGNLPDFGGFREIVQSPKQVSIFYDTGQGQGWHRTFPVDGRPHLPSSVRFWWGDSRGHWEGNTLVVDITNFNGKTEFPNPGVSSYSAGTTSANLHLVERWTRTGPDTLEYAVTIDDPTTWTKPWTVKQEYKKLEDKDNRVYREPRCHEGNMGMLGLLSGTRRMEADFAAGKGPDPRRMDVVTPPGAPEQ
jgi:hypothetical protein